MDKRLNFESFSIAEHTRNTVFLPGDALARLKADATEAGHTSGYNLAQAEAETQRLQIAHILSKKLEQVSFTHVEARKAVLDTLEPLIHAIVAVILPGMAADALSDIVSLHVTTLAASLTDGPIRLVCAPQNVAAMQHVLNTVHTGPNQASVIADETLGAGEIKLAAPGGEQHIDLDRAIADISQAVAAFYQLALEEQNHG